MKKMLLVFFILATWQYAEAQIKIISFSPLSGPVGSRVTITGGVFKPVAEENTVYFGAVKAKVDSAGPNILLVRVPAGASYEPITVITNNLVASSRTAFHVSQRTNKPATLKENSFAAAKYFSSNSTGMRAVLTNDFDGDGKAEIITTNQTGGNVSVFRNISALGRIDSFAIPALQSSITSPHLLAIADMNGDSKKDIITANYKAQPGSISVIPNTTSGSNITFGTKFDSSINTGITALVAADINNDSKTDLLALSETSPVIYYFLNTGTGGNFAFAAQKTIPLPIQATDFILVDMNGDQANDIIIPTVSGITVLLNSTDSTGISFKQPKNISWSSSQPLKIISGDINLDGKPDIATLSDGTDNKRISLFRNKSLTDSLIIDTVYVIIANTNINAFNFADVDGDKLIDVLVANSTSNTVSVYQNKSNSGGLSFGASVSYSINNPFTVIGTDIDGDGLPEMITTNNATGNIGILRNKMFSPVISSFSPQSAATGDTVTIKGENLLSVTSVKFGSTVSTGLQFLQDSIIKTVVGNGSSGYVSISNSLFADSLSGFLHTGTTNNSTINVSGNVQFTVKANVTTPVASYKISGSNLSGNIDINFPQARLMVSRFPDSAFASQLSLTPSNGRLDSTNIYVKLIYTDFLPDSLTINISHTSPGAETKVMPVKIFFEKDTSIAIITLSTPAGPLQVNAAKGIATPALFYYLSGTNLSGNITITAPNRFRISRSVDSGFTKQLSVVPINKKVDSLKIYIQFYSDTIFASITDSISHSSNSAATKHMTIKVSMQTDTTSNILLATPAAPLQMNAAKSIATPALFYYLSGTNLSGNITTTAPNRFRISRFSDSGFTKQLSVAPVNKKVDSLKIYIQFYSDTVYTSIKDSVSHTSTGAITKYMPIKVTMQADTTTPAPNKPTPVLKIHPENKLLFIAKTGITTSVLSYKITADSITDNAIRIFAPRYYQLSRQADTGFTTQLDINFSNGKLDSTLIYVRFRSDSVIVTKTDSITHSLTGGAILKKLAVSVSSCDSVFNIKPIINQVTTDGTLICFKDSVILSVTSPGNLSQYSWSNGATTPTVKVINSAQISVRVATQNTCLSVASPIVNLVKNTNTKPSIGISNDSILISTTAPFYRWYFNNIRSNGDTTNRLIARKVGFYRVETSTNRQCWDASDDLPIVTLARTASTDTVKVRIFPNPVTNGTFTVVASLERVTNVVARVMVTDASGLVLAQTNRFIFYGREIKIPITLSTYKGTAFVRVEINGDVETKTVILQ